MTAICTSVFGKSANSPPCRKYIKHLHQGSLAAMGMAQDFRLLHDSTPWDLSLGQQSDILIVASLCRSARGPPSITCKSIGISESPTDYIGISNKSLNVSSPQRLHSPMKVVVNIVLYMKAPIRNIF